MIQDILREKNVYLPTKQFKVNYKDKGPRVNRDVRRESQQTWIDKALLPTPSVPRTATLQVSISTMSAVNLTARNDYWTYGLVTPYCSENRSLNINPCLVRLWSEVGTDITECQIANAFSTTYEQEKVIQCVWSFWPILQVRRYNPRSIYQSASRTVDIIIIYTSGWILRPYMALRMETAPCSCFVSTFKFNE